MAESTSRAQDHPQRSPCSLAEPKIQVPTGVIDTHAHLTSDPLPERLEDVLDAARRAGVRGILSVGIDATTSLHCVQLAQRYAMVRAAVGIHPNDCCRATDSDWDTIERLTGSAGVVAVGETGLDRYWDDCPWDIQVESFRRHIDLSSRTGLPLVIHTRDCAEETLEVLASAAAGDRLYGVMHSYTGPWEVAAGCLELGLYIGFAGMLTFKNAATLREVARQVPLDRVLVETDAPYLTPHPLRGQRPNHPALVVHTLACLADIHGLSIEEMAARTTHNAEALFGSWPPS
ncbi:MAG: deoxyribonuclease [Pirellulaceae bacterium]|nr:MAG: deoxyribonuclease [Pirellulaceae bacterium]